MFVFVLWPHENIFCYHLGEITAFIHVFVEERTIPKEKITAKKIAEEIKALPPVKEVFIVTGEWDIIVKVFVEDIEALGKFVTDELRKISGIKRTITSIVLA